MENSQAKITISIIEGKFEISGSELFVTQQIENFKDIIEKNIFSHSAEIVFEERSKMKENDLQTSNETSQIISNSTDDIETKFPHIFAIDNEKVNIICDIPGNTDSKKSQNIALMYAYAQKTRNINDVSVDEVRDLCKIHACLDSSNFAAHIKNGTPKLYLMKGNNSSRVITLTIPGEKSALELIKSIKE